MSRKQGFIENVLRKAAYSVGVACSKVSKVSTFPEKDGFKRASLGIKGFVAKTAEKTADIFDEAKESALEMKDSFRKGFESAKYDDHNDNREEAVDENVKDVDIKEAQERPKKRSKRKEAASPKKKKGKADAKTNVEAEKEAEAETTEEEDVELEEPNGDVVNPDFEKEIAELDKKVAEVKDV